MIGIRMAYRILEYVFPSWGFGLVPPFLYASFFFLINFLVVGKKKKKKIISDFKVIFFEKLSYSSEYNKSIFTYDP
jgi:hypothetical protein